MIAWGVGANAGLLTINQSGLYQISALASIQSDFTTVVTAEIRRDPTGAGSGTVIEQASVAVVDEVVVGDEQTRYAKIVLQEIVEVDGSAPLPDRLFAFTVSSLDRLAVLQRGFNNPVGTKVGNVIVEKIA